MKFAKEMSTILCDDIRQEVGNKISLMGIYSKDIFVPEIPFTLAKLCLLLIAKDVQQEIHDLNVIVRIPGNDPVTLALPTPANPKNPQHIQMGVTIAPFNIKAEGEAKIEIFHKKEPKPFITHRFNLICKKAT